ncbi:MAG: hemin receptor [Rhizobiales bacterium]|nr:hemin receptor [Hyphomicrobiales bacterium]
MTPEQISIIKLTFVRVLDIKQEAGRLFYDRLFTIAPDTRAMFGSDIDKQARKLMDTLALVISSLRSESAVATMLDDLGRRHAAYGVRDEHYAKVAEALLWTLERGLGDAFTPEARAAWTTLYGVVAETMQNAAKGSAKSAIG